MEPLLDWGYDVIDAAQRFRSLPADALFRGFSLLGEELFYLLLAPPLYWLLDKRIAARFSVLFLFSVYLNTFAKVAWDQPRPSPDRIQLVIPDPGEGGLPSGHAQNAVVTWGYLGAIWRHGWVKILSVVLIVGIGVSRVYLGVHFPQDVLAGWAIGALLLVAYLGVAPAVERWLVTHRMPAQMAAGAAATLLLALLFSGGVALVAMATLFGIALGVPVERAFVRSDARWLGGWRSGVRLLLGMSVVLLIWTGMREILLPWGDFGRFLRYALLGFWISAGAPWLFVRMRLARREPDRVAVAGSSAA